MIYLICFCFVFADEETIPDGTDALTSNRVTALIANNKDLEEGSSSHDGPEVMTLNGDDLPGKWWSRKDLPNINNNINNCSLLSVPGNGTAATAAAAAGEVAVPEPVVESGENSLDTAAAATTTMVNNVSSSENNSNSNKLEPLEEGSSSQDEEAFKYKNGAGGGNGDISSSTSPPSSTPTTPGGTKRFNAEPLQNVMAKCPKLMLDR